MFFYLNSLDYESVGKLDGSSQILLNYDRINKESDQVSIRPRELHKYPDNDNYQIIPFELISPKTRLTDFCFCGQASAQQNIISPRVKSILDGFTGFGNRFLPVNIYDTQGNCHEYHLLSFEADLPDTHIDFDRTIYSVFGRLGKTVDVVTGRCNLKVGASQIARVKQFSFKDATRLPDFFISPLIPVHFISAKLARRLTEEKVTGIDIYKYDSNSDLGVNTIRLVNHKFN